MEQAKTKPASKRLEKINAWFAFGLCILAGLALMTWSVRYHLRNQRLFHEGKVVPAQVEVGKQLRSAEGKMHPNNSLILAFTTEDGQQIQTQMSIPEEVYRKVTEKASQPSQTVDIRYLPSDPYVVDIVGERDARDTFIILSGGTGLLLFLFGIYGLRVRKREAGCTAPHSGHISDW